MTEFKYNVLEIFYSIDGEGRRAGQLTTFIRFSGCNLHCSWCDTAYSQTGDKGTWMTLDELMSAIREIKCFNITLTGGEPLYRDREAMLALINTLYEEGYDVNIETNGSIDPMIFLRPYGEHNNAVWVTIDYKAKSSGMQDKMYIPAFANLREIDVVKFVVGSRQELQDAETFINTYLINKEEMPSIYFSPVFGAIEPKEIVEFMKEHNYNYKYQVQIQMHKIIWDPNERMV